MDSASCQSLVIHIQNPIVESILEDHTQDNYIRLSFLETISKMESSMLKVNWIVPTGDEPIKRTRNVGLDRDLS